MLGPRQLTALAFVLSVAAPVPARAWGHQRYLRESSPLRGHHLIFDVLERGRVAYCLSDARPVSSRFSAESMRLQTEKALADWLASLEGAPTRVMEVACDAPTLDVKIAFEDLNAGDSGTGIYYSDAARDGRAYMMVRINVGAPRPDGFKETAYADTLRLARAEEERWPEVLAELARDGATSTEAAARRYGREQEDFHFSTFRALYHELGHAFGLCDLYEPNATRYCDPDHRTKDDAPSVMRAASSFGLQADDREGLRALARRFTPPARAR